MRPHLIFCAVAAAAVIFTPPDESAARSDPQTYLLNSACSTYNATNPLNFYANLNQTFGDLRRKLGGGDRHFATAQRGRSSDPVYALAQCRDYLSPSDCLVCVAAAQTIVRNCSRANGARVTYDGCFLRYESSSFFDQSTLAGNTAKCGNRRSSQAGGFAAAVMTLLGQLQAATPRIDGFFAASKIRTAGTSSSAVAYGVAQCAKTLTEDGCRDCLKAAHSNIQVCPPDPNGRAIDAGCFLRYSATPFFLANQTTELSRFLEKGDANKKKAIIGGVIGVTCLLGILLGLAVWYNLSRKRKTTPRGDILGATELRGPVTYRYKDLKSATDNFSEKNKLGEGGFGGVYKGTLKNGNVVAVKKLTINQSSKALADFNSEVRLISNVHHRNLVRLLGCCSKGPELLLVYEYMENKSLDKFLFGKKQGSLNWNQRLNVIVGMARGLAYLHDEFHVRIIHRDIKAGNILLDDQFQPKIADFGLARLLPGDQSHLSTRFAGTLGYTAPEYAIYGQLSEKVDIYGFGVVVLEIISGRRNNELTHRPESDYLLEWIWILYEKGMHLEVVDERLDAGEYEVEIVKKFIEISLMCTQSSVGLRPTMSEVVVLLLSKGSWEHSRPLSRPVFMGSDRKFEVNASTSTASSSNATASTAQVSAR